MTDTELSPQIVEAIDTILDRNPAVDADLRDILHRHLAIHLTNGLKPSDVSSLVERIPLKR